jgi:hypothetical protein
MWRTLLDAVGVVEPIQPGHDVHIDPARVAPIDGNVDHLGAQM